MKGVADGAARAELGAVSAPRAVRPSLTKMPTSNNMGKGKSRAAKKKRPSMRKDKTALLHGEVLHMSRAAKQKRPSMRKDKTALLHGEVLVFEAWSQSALLKS